MNIPKETIEKAIEGGWKPRVTPYQIVFNGFFGLRAHFKAFKEGRKTKSVKQWYIYQNEIALDPTFWQALGKALEWEDKVNINWHKSRWEEPWYSAAMRFYDLNLQGKDTEGFWKELLTN